MSRYPPTDFRGQRDRSRSPPRFSDRRASTTSLFDNRPPAPSRSTSDFPRDSRAAPDGQRPPPGGSPGPPGHARPPYASLRDAPPLGSGARGRPYREREYDRKDRPDRPPSPRERSPPRGFKDSRDLPPRDLDRRESREALPPTGSGYSDSQSLSTASASRGSFRGRGRGEFAPRGGRGGRANLDERDLFRRDRSPPPRWGRDLSRDSRDSDRRDERRFDRREDDRRPPEWSNREREREPERGRRDPVAPRADSRLSNEPPAGNNAGNATSQAPHVNPARLALIESSGADASARRTSVQLEPPTNREARRDHSETPAYLNGRAETTANRYGSRGSSPPTQAPPVPAFTLSFAPPTATTAAPSPQTASSQTSKAIPEPKSATTSLPPRADTQQPTDASESRQEQQADVPTAPRIPPAAPKAQLVSPPPADAPKAPRALEVDDVATSSHRLQDTRSSESLSSARSLTAGSNVLRADERASMDPPHSVSQSIDSQQPTRMPPVSPSMSTSSRLADMNPPTGPRASRMSPTQIPASPRSDAGGLKGLPRAQTPPPTAPLGPRSKSFSVSPKVPAATSIPTAPKAERASVSGQRPPDRGPIQTHRAPDRPAVGTWAPPPAGPRSQPQWNQWRRSGAPLWSEKLVPTKRDMFGEEKKRFGDPPAPLGPSAMNRPENPPLTSPRSAPIRQESRKMDEMDVEPSMPKRQNSMMAGHSAAQSFFGKPSKGEEEDTTMSDNALEPSTTSEDEESDLENDLALFNAKYERQKRKLEADMIDLTSRHYRATTPLGKLARLGRILIGGLDRFDQQLEPAGDGERSPDVRGRHVSGPNRPSPDSPDGADVQTPRDDGDPRVRIRSSDDSSDGMRRVRRATPEPVNLPYLLKGPQSPFDMDGIVGDVLEDNKVDVVELIEEEMQDEEEDEAFLADEFMQEFGRWRERCEDLDRYREEQEKLERQQSLEPRAEVDALPAASANPTFESRRMKFSSEYEMEQVLKQSEETARIEQERQDREARKNQADMEKEARIPDQLTKEEAMQGLFIDMNRYRNAEELSVVFTYNPPTDDFTENEQHIFIAAFRETPKKWGEIASLLPGRTYQDCIRHYYTNKWDGRFRDNRTKKLKAGGRRGRGGPRGPRGRVGIMADLARVEDLLGPEHMSERGRPRRAAAPVTFAEKEAEAKASLLGATTTKQRGPGSKADSNGDAPTDKPGKRQKRTGEKPGRKANKTAIPLAALAAAPHASPGKPFPAGVHSKEDLADANLLANFHGGHHAPVNADVPLIYRQEGYPHPSMPSHDEVERSRPIQAAPAKQAASSYWSVPEQSDFVKYIAYFGKDFGAIAAHMGTKTQTMIKNHYSRQLEGVHGAALEQSAHEAEERRRRGEDMGPPPTPTPIQKRKYENPPAPAQKNIAPHLEGGADLESMGQMQRLSAAAKHASPPQYAMQPRLATSVPTSSATAPRVVPSPLATAATPSAAASYQRSIQNPPGARMSFLTETRADSTPGYRPTQESAARGYLGKPGRPLADAQDPQYLRNLQEERERAIRAQERPSHSDRMEQFHLQPSLQRGSSHGSPLNQPIHKPPERQAAFEDRPASPPTRAPVFPNRPLFGARNFPPLASTTGLGSLASRSPFNSSPTKREEPRLGSLSAIPAAPSPAKTAPPPEPKRSNVLSLLNSDEGPKPAKRDSYPSTIPKAASPVQQGFANAGPPEGPGPRRDRSFGQPSMPHSQFRRESFSTQASTPSSAGPPFLKHESPIGLDMISQGRKPEWPGRGLGQSIQPSSPSPALDRDVHSMYQHRSLLGSLGQSRVNPSPPPLGSNPHSRTPSLSNPPPSQQSRDPLRSGLSGQQQPMPALQPNPYTNQSQSLLSRQQPPSQTQNAAHHAHNSSIGGPFPTFHQRSASRDGYGRPSDRSMHPQQPERETQDSIWRSSDAFGSVKRRGDSSYPPPSHADQERERQQQQALHRNPLQPSSHHSSGPFGNTSAFGQGSGGGRIADVRSQSRIEAAEMAMREEERLRVQQDVDRRRQEGLAREREAEEAARRRNVGGGEDALHHHRRTPLGGSFGVPPPPPPSQRR